MRHLLLKSPASRRDPSSHCELGLLASRLRPSDLAPQVEERRDLSTGMTMGEITEANCRQLGISRREQDEFALRSHALAKQAQEEGRMKDVHTVEVEMDEGENKVRV